MNRQLEKYKKPNWQWRIIILSSLILIFGKTIGHWAYTGLGIEKVYSATSSAMNQAGLSEIMGSPAQKPTQQAQLVIDIKNDTLNEYTVDSRITTGQLNFDGQALTAGEVKRFTVKPNVNTSNPVGLGAIVFTSAPITGNNNNICQEVHVLNYDLGTNSTRSQPIAINLSAITSKMDCKAITAEPTQAE